MDLSTLKLVIEKGPREGETVEFKPKPKLTIRIGRIVRGNTFSIKDNGISSKHLSIEWCSQDKWVVKDLDSSNGTFLNSSALPPLTGHDLHDGDELKIGEVTSIRVRISHSSDSQPVGRNLRSEPKVLRTGNSDGAQKVAEEGIPGGRERGHGRGRVRGDVNFIREDLGMEVPVSVASVDFEVHKDGKLPEEENGRGRGRGRGRCLGKGDAKSGEEGLRLEVSDSTAMVNPELDMEIAIPEVGVRRGRTRGKGGMVIQKPEVNLEISENVEAIAQKGGPVSKRKNKSSTNEEDKVEIVDESLKKAGDVECKAEAPISLRRTTRSRKMMNKDSSAFASALMRIPEASQLVVSINCEGQENVAPTKKQNTRTRRGRKKNEVERDSAQNLRVGNKDSVEEVNEGEQVSRESMHDIVDEDEHLASELIPEHKNCNEVEFVVVKSEPQSTVEGIVSKGDHPSIDSTSEIAKKDGDLACELNFEHENGEELGATWNQDDVREPECNLKGVDFQESTVAVATQKDDDAETAPDLNKMTLREWFDYLERFLPTQIRAETDLIIQDMQKRSQQLHEFMLQQQKPLG